MIPLWILSDNTLGLPANNIIHWNLCDFQGNDNPLNQGQGTQSYKGPDPEVFSVLPYRQLLSALIPVSLLGAAVSENPADSLLLL